jgi:hypothetical protein
MIPDASGDPATLALISGWCRGAINQARLTTPAASRSAAIDGFAHSIYEAANVMLTRYKGSLKLKDWAFAIAKRSTMRKARIALARQVLSPARVAVRRQVCGHDHAADRPECETSELEMRPGEGQADEQRPSLI